MSRPIVVCLTVGVLTCFVGTGCNREKALRKKECAAFADWHNHVGEPIASAVPDAEKAAATTNEKQAAVYRKLAAGARAAARQPNPFTDPYVKSLADRDLKSYDSLAVALDHEADAWARGDKDAESAALREEMSVKGTSQPLMDEWMNHCLQ